jgi:AAA domain/UvrD-like helicase C-terminal domain/Helix-hairpin-helix containing domain
VSKIEIEARFVGERHRFGECLVGSVRLCNGSVESAKKAGHVGTALTVKGDAGEDELTVGQTYRFYGRWSEYFNKFKNTKEKQFHFDTFVPAVAHDEEGIVAYLASVGEGFGMGPGTAKKAWDRWGSEAVRVIRENPRELLTINRRIADEDLAVIGQKLIALQKTEAASIELTNLLHGRGFSKKLPRKLIEKWGNKAAEIVRKDPHALMNFRGCGFKLTDSLYLELGLSKDRLRRQALCGWYGIASDSSGDVWFPIAKAEQAIRAAIGPKATPARAIELGTRLAAISPDHYGALAIVWTDGANGPLLDDRQVGRRWVAEGKHAMQEVKLAKLIVRALAESQPAKMSVFERVEWSELHPRDHVRCHRCSRQLTAPEVHVWNGKPFGPTCIGYISDGTDVEICSLDDWMNSNPVAKKFVQDVARGVVDLPEFSLWPDPAMIQQITEHQREQLALATVGRIGILGGSPGTGKTHTTAQLVRALLATGRLSPEDIAIGCPTGKAAVRITEFLQAARIPIRAKTWHSLLGIGQTDDRDGWGFKFNDSNPWPYRVIIGDEESMKDLSLACAVMSARPRGAHMLLVGDVNQLPPVGPGAPLRDMIAAGLLYGELTEIVRNSGGIVESCKAIREGKPWGPGDNLHILTPAGGPAAQIETAEKIIDKCRAQGLDPVWDVQIIVAVNKTSPLSRKAINAHFQGFLNPPTANQPSKEIFRVDDKVVCLKNGYFSLIDAGDKSVIDDSLLNDQGQMYVANGQLARVMEVEEKSLIVKLEKSSIEIRIPRGKQSENDDSDDDSSNGCSFDLAYGLSCHKFQGSECPVVIVMIDEFPGAKMVCDRSWVYTAISRARQNLYLVGKKSTVDAFCRKQMLPKRKTFLRERIGLLQAEKMLEAVS